MSTVLDSGLIHQDVRIYIYIYSGVHLEHAHQIEIFCAY